MWSRRVSWEGDRVRDREPCCQRIGYCTLPKRLVNPWQDVTFAGIPFGPYNRGADFVGLYRFERLGRARAPEIGSCGEVWETLRLGKTDPITESLPGIVRPTGA